MKDRGYENNRSVFDARNMAGAVKDMVGTSHSMHNFLNEDANEKPDRSVLSDPQTQRLAQQYDPMIDKYRGDIETTRRGVTHISRNPLERVGDAIDDIRGPIKAGEPGRKEERHAPAVPERHSAPLHLNPYAPGKSIPDYIHPGREQPSGPGIPFRNATTSVGGDPSAFLDRMLAASQNGDRDTFRQMTQDAASAPPGRALREEAVATVDRQEHALAQQAAQQQAQTAEQASPARSGPRMA